MCGRNGGSREAAEEDHFTARAQSKNMFLLISCVCLVMLDVYMCVPSLWAYLEVRTSSYAERAESVHTCQSVGATKFFYGSTTMVSNVASAASSVLMGTLLDRGCVKHSSHSSQLHGRRRWGFKNSVLWNLVACAFAGFLYFAGRIFEEKILSGTGATALQRCRHCVTDTPWRALGMWVIAIARVIVSISNGALGPTVLVYIARYSEAPSPLAVSHTPQHTFPPPHTPTRMSSQQDQSS